MSKKQKTTFTKKAMSLILIVALIDMQLPFILAFMDKPQIAEDLGKIIVVEIIGVFLVYCCKSFFETKEEVLTRLREKAMQTPLSESAEETTEAIAE